MALVISLIMLSVTLIMAVAFLALSRRERSAVTTTTDTAAARLAADSTHPITDLRATAGYRKRVAEVLVRRLLSQAAGLIPAEA